MNRIFWSGYCNKARNAGINDIVSIINQYGFVLDYKMFSDLNLSIIIETTESKVDDLFNDLREYLNMNDYEKSLSVSAKECVIFLNVSFPKGTGDLSIEIPDVPG